VRVLGKCFGNASDIMAGMLWAAGIHVAGVPDNTTNKASVINMSLGGGSCQTTSSELGLAYQDVVNQVIAQGVTIVAAAGNSDGKALEAPASCTGVIGVAAVRHIGTKVGFSSLGPEVVISAPGGNCVNTTGACLYPIIAATNTGSQGPLASAWFDSFKYEVGTSFSSPMVAGVVGLMYSLQPNLTPAQVRSKLSSTARAFPTSGAGAGIPQCQAPSSATQSECYCTTSTCGAGMMDAGAAVAAVAVSGPAARITLTPAAPTAGTALTLSASTSTPSGSNTITGYQWTLTSGGGIIPAIADGGTIATSVTATLVPSAAGTFTVTLAVTDGAGNTGLASQTITVAAAATGGGTGSTGNGGGGGGGALSLPWLALLALAVVALLRTAPRRA